MAFTTITTRADVGQGLPAEEIIAGLLAENRAPAIAATIATMRDFRAVGASTTQNIVRIKTVAARTQATDGDDLTADDVALDEESITPVTHYIYRVLTAQANKDFAPSPLDAEILQQGVRAVMDKEDSEGLAKFQNAIASVGSSASTFDLTLWGTMQYTYASLDSDMQPVFVGHEIHIRDLLASIRSSGGAIESTGRAANLFTGIRGLRGEFEGIPVFGSTNVSEASSAKVGAMLGVGVLQYGVWNDMAIERQRAVENIAEKLVIWKRTGFELATNGEASTGADSSIVKVLCKNS